MKCNILFNNGITMDIDLYDFKQLRRLRTIKVLIRVVKWSAVILAIAAIAAYLIINGIIVSKTAVEVTEIVAILLAILICYFIYTHGSDDKEFPYAKDYVTLIFMLKNEIDFSKDVLFNTKDLTISYYSKIDGSHAIRPLINMNAVRFEYVDSDRYKLTGRITKNSKQFYELVLSVPVKYSPEYKNVINN